MRFGSLFAGIGGIDLGLERAGMECVWQVEIDPFCSKVLAKHWPEVKRHGDIREVGSDNLEPVDLICGGFPCQDISYAGKGAGIEGERSGLWKEFFRVICELRPRFVLVENVPALLSRGLGVVLRDLAACGYDAEWESLPACAFGAPHRRDRVFIVAHATGIDEGCTYQEGRASFQSRNLCRRMPWFRWENELESSVCRKNDGVPDRVDRLRSLGNAVVPQVAEWIGQQIMTSLNDCDTMKR